MTKIKDVAELANVSSATVSRVLNGDQRVSALHRERVQAAVAELGYRPNRVARSLRRRQTETIGVVVSDIENPHFTQAVRAIEDAAYSRGYRLLLCNTDETPDKQKAYLEVLAAERVLGVILVPADPGNGTISDLLDANIPIVAFDRSVEDGRADAVIAENVEATRRATHHLLGLGHTHIGFIGGRTEIQTGVDRRAGYEKAMRARRLEPCIASGQFRLETAQLATDQLLRDHPDITALVVANNLMTIGALRALAEAGRRVPDDIAIVGVDDPFWAELVDPPLTTLAQPVRRMAETAFELLLERVTGTRAHPRHVVFHFELNVRRSCGSAG